MKVQMRKKIIATKEHNKKEVKKHLQYKKNNKRQIKGKHAKNNKIRRKSNRQRKRPPFLLATAHTLAPTRKLRHKE